MPDLVAEAGISAGAFYRYFAGKELQGEARRGLQSLAGAIASALSRGQRAGRVPTDLDPDDGARLLLSLLPGVILQRAATDDDVAAAVARAATALLDG